MALNIIDRWILGRLNLHDQDKADLVELEADRTYAIKTLAKILKISKLSLSVLESKSRTAKVTACRNLFYVKVRENTGLTLSKIGEYFNQNHSTVSNAKRNYKPCEYYRFLESKF